MDCNLSEELFDEIIEYDDTISDDNSDKENEKILPTRKPTDNQYKMIRDCLDNGNYTDMSKGEYEKMWTHLTTKLNDIGPPSHTQAEWRRKWSVHKYKTNKKMSTSHPEKRQDEAAQSKGTDEQGSDTEQSRGSRSKGTESFRQNVLSKLDNILKRQDVIISNQEAILDKIS